MAQVMGKSLLAEIEMTSLKDLLDALKSAHHKYTGLPQQKTGISAVDGLWHKHGGDQLQVSGRYKALLYHIISGIVSAPRNGVVMVVDTDGKFDITKLDCTIDDLKHVWVIRARDGMDDAQKALKAGTDWLVYGQHASRGRDLALRIVSGGPGGPKVAVGADIVAGFRGWLRVECEKQDVPRFAPGLSVDEATREAGQRLAALERSRWTASSDEGIYRWAETSADQ